MTFISPAAPTGTRPASEHEFTPIRASAGARIGDDLHEALSDMTEIAVTEFLITCARAVNEAAKRNDLEAVHAIYHAECAALLEIHNRQGAMQ